VGGSSALTFNASTGTATIGALNVTNATSHTGNVAMNLCNIADIGSNTFSLLLPPPGELFTVTSGTQGTAWTSNVSGGRKYYTFYSNCTITAAASTGAVEYFAVGGGGGGGSNQAGGGGAGGLQTNVSSASFRVAFASQYLTISSLTANSNYTIVIGAGGAGQTNGSNTTIIGAGISINALGGGAGANAGGSSASTGGCAGGATNFGSTTAATGSQGGNGGGAGTISALQYYLGAGGGGIGGNGQSVKNGGSGGDGANTCGNGGTTLTFNGSAYGGGGGGGGQINPASGGGAGAGAGGQNVPGGSATANTGSGGGGGSSGGSGGSGIVIISYPSTGGAAVVTSFASIAVNANSNLQLSATSNIVLVAPTTISGTATFSSNTIHNGALTVNTSNIALGSNAGTAGTQNVNIGLAAGSGTSTSYNVVLGSGVGTGMTGAGYNVAIGSASTGSNSTATSSVMLGVFAGTGSAGNGNFMFGNTVSCSGDFNIAMGYNIGVIQGSNNVAIGNVALHTNNATTNSCIAIGYDAGFNAAAMSNAIFLGSNPGYTPSVFSNIMIIYSTSTALPALQADLSNRWLGVGKAPTAALDVAGTISNTYSGSAPGYTITGTDTVGGAGYINFLRVSNTYVGATNPVKTFRLDSAGTFQILNSTYTSPPLLTITDAGFTSTGGGAQIANTLLVTGSSLFISGNGSINSNYGGLTAGGTGEFNLWWGSSGNGGANDRLWRFAWQNDRNVVIYTGGTANWSTGTSTSDGRLKTNVVKTSLNCVDIVMTTDVVDFEWKADSDIADGGKTHTGFIAQDLEDKVPDAVKTVGGTKLLHKEELVPILWRALQDTMLRVSVLEQTISNLMSSR
jgi:hypothetical protein